MTEFEWLWQRYVELFKENTRLINLLHKKEVKMDVTQTPGIVPEDPISAQMAEANSKPVEKEGGEAPVLVRERFVQDQEMLTGTPVVI